MTEQLTGRQLMGIDPVVYPGSNSPLHLGAEDDTVSRETGFTSVMVRVYSWGADCMGSKAGLLSLKTPVIWPYVTGKDGVMWTEEQIRLFKDAGAKVYRVNQGDASQPFLGDEFDVESGAITAEQVIGIVQARRERQWSTRVYGTYATYEQVTGELASLGLRRSVWWRIADWDLSRHLAELSLWGDVYAAQWASPSSNPGTMLPGTSLTLKQANADLSVVLRESTGWEG